MKFERENFLECFRSFSRRQSSFGLFWRVNFSNLFVIFREISWAYEDFERESFIFIFNVFGERLCWFVKSPSGRKM